MTQQKTQDAPAQNGQPAEEAPIVKSDFDALANVKVAGELDLLTAAKAFAASGMFPDVKKQSQAVVKIVAGYELGVKPFAAMRGIHFITFKSKVTDESGRERWVEQGVLELSANLRGALIKRSGHYDYRVRELTAERCVIEFFERAPGGGAFESVGTSEYSVEQATKAGITGDRGSKKSNWILYPEDMCFAAALRRGAKRFCPDLFVGELAMDDATAVAAVAEHELKDEPKSDIVDGEIVGDTDTDPAPDPVQASTGDEGASAGQAAAEAPEVASEQAPTSDSLFDDTPPDDTPPPDGAEAPLVVGLITVPPAPGGPHSPAADTVERLKSDRIKQLRGYMSSLNLTDGALEHIWRGRYRFELSEGGTVSQGDALEIWLQQQGAKPKGSK